MENKLTQVDARHLFRNVVVDVSHAECRVVRRLGGMEIKLRSSGSSRSHFIIITYSVQELGDEKEPNVPGHVLDSASLASIQWTVGSA